MPGVREPHGGQARGGIEMRMTLGSGAASHQLVRAWWIVALVISLAPAARGQTLKKVDAFDLPGPPGKRFDYLTIDYKHDYLLSASSHVCSQSSGSRTSCPAGREDRKRDD